MTTSNIAARSLLVVLMILSIILLALIISPFAAALFLAAVLAAAFSPWYERLAKALGNRRYLAGGIVTFGVVVALVLPVGAIGAIVVKQALAGIAFVRDTLRSEGASGLIQRLPKPLQSVGERLLDELPKDEEGRETLSASAAPTAKAATAVGGVLQATSRAVLQTVMMLIGFFFLLVDGWRLVEWLNVTLPLRRVQLRELLEECRRVSVAVLLSTLATSGVQAVVAYIGYAIAKVPNGLFFALLTFFVGLIPAVGAASVSVLLAGLLLLTGHMLPAIFLLAWGVVVVGLVDNVVKPLFIKGGLELHGAVIFFALLGGLAVFGAVGLLAGPLTVVFFLASLRLCRKEFAESPPPELITR